MAELATGFFGLVSGSRDEAVFILVHRVAEYAVLAVPAWKARVVLFSLGKPAVGARSPAPRTASLVLAVLLVATLAMALAWSTTGPFAFRWFSGVSWHIYVGALLAPVLAWHALHHTRVFRRSFWADRRWFLRLAGVSVAGLALWQLNELASRSAGFAGPSRRFTGSYRTPGDGGHFPVVSWLND